MVLSDTEILKAIDDGAIVIRPFDRASLGSNSYDVHLGKHLAVYEDGIIDAAKLNPIRHFEIPEEGFVLRPCTLYLATTLEYCENHKHMPLLDGKSNTGKLGITIKAAAGTGDVGFCNHWSLHLSVFQSVRVYAGMPIGQLVFFEVYGRVEHLYQKKNNPKNIQVTGKPQESGMWKNDFFKKIPHSTLSNPPLSTSKSV